MCCDKLGCDCAAAAAAGMLAAMVLGFACCCFLFLCFMFYRDHKRSFHVDFRVSTIRAALRFEIEMRRRKMAIIMIPERYIFNGKIRVINHLNQPSNNRCEVVQIGGCQPPIYLIVVAPHPPNWDKFNLQSKETNE